MSLPEIEAQSPSLDRPASAIRNVPRPVERLPPARRGASREAAGKSRVRHLGGTCGHKARAGDEQFCAVAETYGGSATEDPPFGGLWCDQPALFLFG